MKPYQPANGTEGECFMEQYCYRCKHDDIDDPEGMCEIIPLTMMHDPGDPEYPKEWIYGEDGSPTCTKFEERE